MGIFLSDEEIVFEFGRVRVFVEVMVVIKVYIRDWFMIIGRRVIVVGKGGGISEIKVGRVYFNKI